MYFLFYKKKNLFFDFYTGRNYKKAQIIIINILVIKFGAEFFRV